MSSISYKLTKYGNWLCNNKLKIHSFLYCSYILINVRTCKMPQVAGGEACGPCVDSATWVGGVGGANRFITHMSA